MNESISEAGLDKQVPCREQQIKTIRQFIEKRLADRSGGCMYICGMPGTGKTESVLRTISLIKASRKTGKISYVFLNCMKLSNSPQAYVEICHELYNKKYSSSEAVNVLNERFNSTNTNKNAVILVVDELDALCKKKQNVIYNIFNWTTYENSKLVIITIANTMDLPERLLDKKIYSRLGLTRIVFQPYSFTELCTILKVKKFNNKSHVKGDALELIARKVASVSGDVRRAFEITSMLDDSKDPITIENVLKLTKEIVQSPQVYAIKNCSSYEKVVIKVLLDQAEKLQDGSQPLLHEIYPEICAQCTLDGLPEPTMSILLLVSCSLESMGLVLNLNSSNDLDKKLVLNVGLNDIRLAFENS